MNSCYSAPNYSAAAYFTDSLSNSLVRLRSGSGVTKKRKEKNKQVEAIICMVVSHLHASKFFLKLTRILYLTVLINC